MKILRELAEENPLPFEIKNAYGNTYLVLRELPNKDYEARSATESRIRLDFHMKCEIINTNPGGAHGTVSKV